MGRDVARIAPRSALDGDSGAVAVPFAIALTALVAAAGGSIDVLRAYEVRSCYQHALDASLLNAVVSLSPTRLTEAGAFYKSNCRLSATYGGEPQFTVSADGSIAGRVTTDMKTSFLRLVNIKTVPISAQGKAIAKRDSSASVEFTALQAQGWYAKDIYAFVRDTNGNIVQTTKVLSYDYDYNTDTKKTSPPLNSSTSTFTLSGGSSFGVMMRVWPNTKNIGSRKGAYIDYYSDAPAPRVKTSGQCSTGQTFSWEDGGDSNYQDFVYVMKCKSMLGQPTAARLTQ